MNVEDRQILTNLQNARQFFSQNDAITAKADYNCAYEITEDEVRDIVNQSHKFVKMIEDVIFAKL